MGMITAIVTSLGPLISGHLQESTGDLKLTLVIMSLTSVSLILAGMTLRFGNQQPVELAEQQAKN